MNVWRAPCATVPLLVIYFGFSVLPFSTISSFTEYRVHSAHVELCSHLFYASWLLCSEVYSDQLCCSLFLLIRVVGVRSVALCVTVGVYRSVDCYFHVQHACSPFYLPIVVCFLCLFMMSEVSQTE